jgi:hypothetical protein
VVFCWVIDKKQNESSSSSPPRIKCKTTPQLLLVTRPQTNIDYSLWPVAHKVWAANQPSETMTNYGKQRCWSTFGHFSDNELQDACVHYLTKALQLDSKGHSMCFEDRLLLFAAYR